MSRIGKKDITVPSGVTLNVDGQKVTAKGPKGELSFTLPKTIHATLDGDTFSVSPANPDLRADWAMWGMSRTMVANLIEGVTEGYKKELELRGVGYRAQMKGNTLVLALGYSHDVEYPTPDGITIKTGKPTEITVEGIDKQKVGQVAAEIRSFRKPEPYKGKGVRYVGEYVRQKEGKRK